jgi:hypothetical protein
MQSGGWRGDANERDGMDLSTEALFSRRAHNTVIRFPFPILSRRLAVFVKA